MQFGQGVVQEISIFDQQADNNQQQESNIILEELDYKQEETKATIEKPDYKQEETKATKEKPDYKQEETKSTKEKPDFKQQKIKASKEKPISKPISKRNKKIELKDVFLGGFEQIKNPQLYNENNLKALKNKVQEYQNMKINELQNYSIIYKKKLENFKKRKFMNQISQHQYNIVCQQLLKKQKYTNSMEMLQQKYVNLYFDWINLLDLRDKDKNKNKQEIHQQFEEIVEILQQFKIKQDQQYFNKYQIYDFANLSISLIEQLSKFRSMTIENQEMYEEQQISEVNTKLTEKYAKFFTSICDLRDQKYNKKMELNFTKQTIEMLLENDTTKLELKEVIQDGINDPKSWFNDAEKFNQEKKNKLIEILENLKRKYKLL